MAVVIELFSRNSILSTFTHDINEVNISGLSNYYDRTTSDTNYYTKSYVNANYYPTTTIDSLLNTPSMPAISGFINSAGVMNRDNGLLPVNINKTATGTFNVRFNTVAVINNYTFGGCLRSSTGGMAT